MALHRDIYWVGKQWAVTGYGVQACDQKQKSKFDIPADKIWEDDVLDAVRALKWFNAADFDQALSVAREHYPEPPRKIARARKTEPPKESAPPGENAPPRASAMPLKESVSAVPPKPAPRKPETAKPSVQKFHLRAKGSAKFLPQWRVRLRRQPR